MGIRSRTRQPQRSLPLVPVIATAAVDGLSGDTARRRLRMRLASFLQRLLTLVTPSHRTFHDHREARKFREQMLPHRLMR